MSWLSNIFKPKQKAKTIQQQAGRTVRDTTAYYTNDLIQTVFNGDKFPGSFGITKDYNYVDYYTLRRRSMQLFKENSYARGAIRRILRNEIYTGLNLEANPLSELIGLSEEESIAWAERSELNFRLWANDPTQCDYNKEKNFGQLQHDARQTALISGDCLIINHVNKKTGLPMIQIIDGANVQSNLSAQPQNGNYIVNGIEYNSRGIVVAYHVQNIGKYDPKNGSFEPLKSKRIPAYGEKSGKRIAWMIYGTDKLLHENRGEPILSSVLYMLKDLDRYKDAELRAAVVNAIIPLFVKKTEKTVGSQPFGAGAVRRDTVQVSETDGVTRDFNITHNLPGQVVDELAYGEEIVSHNTMRPNVNYKVFEDAILNGFAWSLELPPEILKLLFQSNFSASRQANNELNVYLQYRFWKFGSEFCQPIYNDFLVASALYGYIKADGMIDAKRTGDFMVLNAWNNAEWSGLSRPSVDINKDANAAETTLKLRIATYDYWSRRITGMSFRNTLQKISRETELLKRSGILSSVDENNNGEPVQTNSNQAGLQRQFVAMISDFSDRLDEIEGAKQ